MSFFVGFTAVPGAAACAYDSTGAVEDRDQTSNAPHEVEPYARYTLHHRGYDLLEKRLVRLTHNTNACVRDDTGLSLSIPAACFRTINTALWAQSS